MSTSLTAFLLSNWALFLGNVKARAAHVWVPHEHNRQHAIASKQLAWTHYILDFWRSFIQCLQLIHWEDFWLKSSIIIASVYNRGTTCKVPIFIHTCCHTCSFVIIIILCCVCFVCITALHATFTSSDHTKLGRHSSALYAKLHQDWLSDEYSYRHCCEDDQDQTAREWRHYGGYFLVCTTYIHTRYNTQTGIKFMTVS